ncbi:MULTISPECIES: hypothetical protein [unclassified Streptomyces]|uniref:hypothetical protein n=1 Tax=unclassified Streptomyces TaxID=2593676 RepID=UPI0009BCE30A|nr:hypothetical protein [Streptomyces sp. M41(2017)]OQQ16364.1 hypothetical protein B0675_03655 [Streptomyces sp. M41(2017)]
MAEYEGVDALLAAITDASLPQGARDDVVFMAEHRAAREDVDMLREQLIVIGDALADPGNSTGTADAAKTSRKAGKAGKPAGAKTPTVTGRPGQGRPGSAPGRSRRRGAFAVGALAAAAVASLVVGMGWLVAQGGAGANDTASADSKRADTGGSLLSAPGYLACSRLVAEGTVARVSQEPGTGQDRITLDVYHYYKPAKGEKEITFLMEKDVFPRLHKGDEVLVGIPRGAAGPDIWTTGDEAIARERSWIVKALPESRGMKCGE